MKIPDFGLPPELLKLMEEVEEGLVATGKVLSDEQKVSNQLYYTIGCLAALCWSRQPDHFSKLREHVNELVLRVLTKS